MRLAHEEIDRIANEIASTHRGGWVCHDAGPHRPDGMVDAEAVQAAVLHIPGDARIGYALGSTSGRLLGCSEPVAAPLFCSRIRILVRAAGRRCF